MTTRSWLGIGIGLFANIVVNCGARTELDEMPSLDPPGLAGASGSGPGGHAGDPTAGAGGEPARDGGWDGSGASSGTDGSSGSGGAAGSGGKGGTGGSGGFGGDGGSGGLGGRGGFGGAGGMGGLGGKGGFGGAGGRGGFGGSGGRGGFGGAGGRGGFGGSGGRGGNGGRGGGTPGNPLLDLLPGVRQTPQCTSCVNRSCAEVANCSATPACLTGVSCAISTCSTSGMNQLCLLRCFNGDARQVSTAISAVQCVYGTCGASCTAGLPITDPWLPPDEI